jgi:hypothetical protein
MEDPSLLGCDAVLSGEIDTPCLSAHLFLGLPDAKDEDTRSSSKHKEIHNDTFSHP